MAGEVGGSGRGELKMIWEFIIGSFNSCDYGELRERGRERGGRERAKGSERERGRERESERERERERARERGRERERASERERERKSERERGGEREKERDLIAGFEHHVNRTTSSPERHCQKSKLTYYAKFLTRLETHSNQTNELSLNTNVMRGGRERERKRERERVAGEGMGW